MEVIVLLLPVIWALVATGIGLVLYRSSRALFSSQESSATAKKIRLTGSVVIAALFFLLIRQATPSGNLTSIPKGSVILSADRAAQLSRLGEQIEAEAVEFNACLSALDPQGQGCQDSGHRIRRMAGELNGEFGALTRDPPR